MTRITIVIDDQDRDQAPEKPWAAYITDNGGIDAIDSVEAGLGVTPQEALADLAASTVNWEETP